MGVPSLEVTLSCDTTSSFPTGLEEPDVFALPRGMMPQTKALPPSTVQTAQLPRIHLPRTLVNTTLSSAPFGALPEPGHGRCRARVQNRDVPVFRVQSQFRRRTMAREPLAVRGGHHPIPATVQDKGRSDDVGGVEAPRPDAGEIVVDEPSHAAGEGGTDHVDEPRPLAGESGLVFGGELRLVTGLSQVLLQRSAPGRRRAQLGHARWSESFEPFELLGVERG